MMSAKQSKLLQKNAAREARLADELRKLAADIEASEKLIGELERELVEINTKYQGPRTTQQDVDYLSGLLACAKKKLAWEQQISAIRAQTPKLLTEIGELLQNPEIAPTDSTRLEMLQVLQQIQAAMARLSTVSEH